MYLARLPLLPATLLPCILHFANYTMWQIQNYHNNTDSNIWLMPVQNTVPRTRSQTAFPPWLPPHTCAWSTDLYLIPLWQPGLKHQNRKYTLVSTSYLQIANVRPSNALLFFISKHKSFWKSFFGKIDSLRLVWCWHVCVCAKCTGSGWKGPHTATG